jgi:hypothetical protein
MKAKAVLEKTISTALEGSSLENVVTRASGFKNLLNTFIRKLTSQKFRINLGLMFLGTLLFLDLLIATYHKGEHFFEIPGCIKKLVPQYNLRFIAMNGASPVIERYIGASIMRI